MCRARSLNWWRVMPLMISTIQPGSFGARGQSGRRTPVSGSRNGAKHGSVTERRSSVRRMGKTIKVLVSNANAQSEPMQGWVCDRSMGGLCLAVPRAVDINMIVSVRTTDADPSTPWIQVEVKRSIILWEPRVTLNDVQVATNPADQRAVDITITYTLIATQQREGLNLTFALQA